MITNNIAIQSVADRQRVTASTIEQLLVGKKYTKVRVRTVTQQKVAVKYRSTHTIHRVTEVDMELFSDADTALKYYARPTTKNYEPSEQYFTHADTYCVATHNAQRKQYLYGNVLNQTNMYVKDGAVISAEEIAPFCTKSGERKVLEQTPHFDSIMHSDEGQVKTLALASIVALETI